MKSIAWDCTGTLLATCSRDKSVWIWEDVGNGEFECASVLNGHQQDVKAVLWHPSEQILFSASYDDTIKAWSEDEVDDDWSCADTLAGHTSTVWGISFNREGSLLGTLQAVVRDVLGKRVWEVNWR